MASPGAGGTGEPLIRAGPPTRRQALHKARKVFDKRLPNSEPKLRELFDKLQSNHGTVLVVVDQPASIGALPLAVARDTRCQLAYLPGLTVRRIADLYPGEAKADAHNAHVIAVAARTPDVDTRAVELA